MKIINIEVGIQEVGWKGNEHWDATQLFKLATYTCMPPSFQ